MFKTMRLVRIGGIDVHLDWSLLIVFFLVTASLGGGLFREWHPEWASATAWATGAAAATLFLASVLIHELSHALVGRRHGVDIKRITLFVFGGMAHLEREPATWRAELAMAAIGPIVSLAIGVLCGALAGIGLTPESAPLAVIREAGPLRTLLLWLAPVNVVLAIFNFVPAFPLDGGRVLRAIVWGATGDFVRATQFAARLGEAFSWLLILAGVATLLGWDVPLVAGSAVNGIWLALIGWFLHNAAAMSYRQATLRESLAGVPVARLMQTRFATVDADAPLETLVADYFMRNEQRCYPVVDPQRFAGLVCLADVRRASRADWARMRVRDVMTPAERLATTSPGEAAMDALAKLGERAINQLPVLERGEIVGLLSREDVVKWLSFYNRGEGRDASSERGDAGGT